MIPRNPSPADVTAFLDEIEGAAISGGMVSLSMHERSAISRYVRGSILSWFHSVRNDNDLYVSLGAILGIREEVERNIIAIVASKLSA